MAAKVAKRKPVELHAEPRTVDLPPLSIRAEVQSVNDEARTVDLVFSTGAPVTRTDYWTGKSYIETLSLEEGHVRIDRLNEGGSLLDSHAAYSVADILGSVVPGSVTLTKKEARARVQFSKREAVEPIWQDVKAGIIRHVSVGYRIYKFEETEGKGNALPVRRAIDWEPFEVSMVPIPADAGARVRDGDRSDTNPCVIARATRPAEEAMRKAETPSETIVERNPLAPNEEVREPEPTEPDERQEAAAQERARCEGILQAVRKARVPLSWADEMIKDGTSLLDAQQRCLDEVGRRNVNDVPGPTRVDPGADPFVHVRAGIENALLHRARPRTPEDPNGFELSEVGRMYRGMTLIDVARAYLNQQGIRTTELSKQEIARIALGLRGGMHTTSDFANLLADLPGKILRSAYEEAPQTFAPIVRRMTTGDFKKLRLLQLGAAPALLEVGEHGEFTEGTMGESKEETQLRTWGRKFSITRQALINDDTDAFSRVPMAFGRQARSKESDLVWAEINNNAAMGDGIALFHASHGNLAGAGAAIDVATIGAGRAAMRAQKDLDGATKIDVNPMFLIVPVAKQTIAEQFVSVNLLASAATSVNPFAGKLTVIAEPRLDDSSAVSWYLSASPASWDVIALVFLEGELGPTVESRISFDVDGLEIKVRHDVVAKVVDFRGLYKNPGA